MIKHSLNPKPAKRSKTITLQPSPGGMIQVPAAQRVFRTTGSKRPTDKNLIAVLLGSVNGTQQNVTLTTVTFPCTIVGIRWMINVEQAAGTGLAANAWCINVLRDGGTQKNMSFSNGSTFFAPESDCLVFAISSIDNNTETKTFEGSTKTMRKMMGGDKLIFSALGVATETSTFRGVIQFFCKT